MPLRSWTMVGLILTSMACRPAEPVRPPAPSSPAPAPAPATVKAAPEPPRPAPTFRAVSIPPNYSPDPNYWPHPGDRATLWKFFPEGTGSPVAADWFAFGEMVKFLEARDVDGLKDQVGSGRVALVPMGSEALVLDVRGDPDRHQATDPVQVRVFRTDGESLQVWTPRVCVVKLTPD